MDFRRIWFQHSGSGGAAVAGPMTAEKQTASEIRSRGAPQWGPSDKQSQHFSSFDATRKRFRDEEYQWCVFSYCEKIAAAASDSDNSLATIEDSRSRL